MKFTMLIVLLALCTVFAVSQEENFRHISIRAEVMVFDRQLSIESLITWAEENGGFFTEKTDKSLRLRVPDDSVSDFRGILEENSRSILVFDQSTIDLRREYQRVVSALEASEEVLARNLQYIDSSDLEGTLELEQEIRRLMEGIDTNKGMLRKMNHDRKLALIEVFLDFQSRTVPQRRTSSYPWINSVDFFDFVLDSSSFSNRLSSVWRKIKLPEGFALLRNRPDIHAISARGIKLRVREVDNYPLQSSDFWNKILKEDLAGRGYTSLREFKTIDWEDAGNIDYHFWAIPLNTVDFIFVVGIGVQDATITIIEMAGPAESVIGYLRP